MRSKITFNAVFIQSNKHANAHINRSVVTDNDTLIIKITQKSSIRPFRTAIKLKAFFGFKNTAIETAFVEIDYFVQQTDKKPKDS